MVNERKTYLESKFVEYNAKYFDGKLVLPHFIINNWTCTARAMFRYSSDKNKKPVKPKIWMSTKYVNWDNGEVDLVLIHEMIHYYIVFIIGRDPLFSHGLLFFRMWVKIRKKSGLKIPYL